MTCSPMKRYLIHFSYIGTYFRGVQRQIPRDRENNEDPTTVQGLMEYALSRMRPQNPVMLVLSSRTDQGVHAMQTAACVSLSFQFDVEPSSIHHFLNRFFDDTDLDIRVNSVREVSPEFNPRRLPVWRKYLYRFAILKPDLLSPKGQKISKCVLPIPITEYRKCYFVDNTKFNLELTNEAMKHFIGTKDFLSFVSKPNLLPPDIPTIRRIDELYIEPGYPFMPSNFNQYYDYYNLICVGKSFLYKQIRRTVTVLLAVAQETITPDDVKHMIDNPKGGELPKSTGRLAPSHGLYLMDVFYNEEDLAYTPPIPEPEVAHVEDETSKKKRLIKERLRKIEALRMKKTFESERNDLEN